MRRAMVVLALFCAGCNLDFLTNTSINNQGGLVDTDDGQTGGTNGTVSGFVVEANSSGSSVTVSWSGPGCQPIVATRADGTTETFGCVDAGDDLNPAAGGGSWTFCLGADCSTVDLAS